MKSLKKILSYMMIIIMSVFLFLGVDFKEASADETLEFPTSKGKLYYEISNNEVTIIRYFGEDTKLEIYLYPDNRRLKKGFKNKKVRKGIKLFKKYFYYLWK